MCTVITLQRPGSTWPLLLAANRDEMLDRPWDPPAPYWPDLPRVVAGRDRTAGGTWMGANADGVVAAVLNRPGSLGPAAGKRSRGEIPLLALGQATAAAAAAMVAQLDGRRFRSFNLVIADRAAVWFVRNDDDGCIAARELSPGLHMITAHDPDDFASPRVSRHLPRFLAAAPPDPPDWRDWARLLADEEGPRDASISVPPANGFGTACASLLGLPAEGPPAWWFAPGRAGHTAFAPLAFHGGSGD